MSGDPFMAELRRLQEENRALQAKLAKYEARLEIDKDGNGVEIPPDQRDKFPDGIYCRDATIQLQDQRVDELQAKLAAVEAERDNWKVRYERANATAVDEGERLLVAQQRITALENILKACDWALLMWMRTYAKDEVSAQHYMDARQFLQEHGGTLAYIALLRRDIEQAQHALRSIPGHQDSKETHEHGQE